MKITVGSKWVAKDRKDSIQATVQQADGDMIHYLYDGGSGITYSVPVSCFLEFFEPATAVDTKDDITVGSIWDGKCGEGEVKVNFFNHHYVNYSYLTDEDGDFDMKHDDFRFYFSPISPEPDTGDDIVVGSRWLYCGSVEVEVIDVAVDGEGDVIITHEDEDGGLDYDIIAYFRERYQPVVGMVGFDNVNNPQHYTNGQVECIDAIRAALTDEEFRGFCKGNVLKYTWREKHKGGNESLEKAVWYLKQMVGE